MPNRQSKPIMFEATRPVLVDARNTTKSYIAIYSVIKEFSHRNPESVIELLIPNSKGMLHDIATWCETTGNKLIGSEFSSDGGTEDIHVVIQKGVRTGIDQEGERGREKKMTVVISTADLDYVVPPLDKALAGKVLGMDVSVVFEGAGVKLLKNGYRATRSGLFGNFRTSSIETSLTNSGSPLPSEGITMLKELGAKFYVCGPSMEANGVRQEELVVEHSIVGSTVTWVSLLEHSGVNVFSKAKFDTP
ncbi:uncharacterized protein PAC_02550 [Phialocephala subalpina]|uniref:Uncharacterized protein n=1 Tax=Phialocephala subalpina TaxID=576137 RepID=A0A1L7WIS0_9HELO|nr:uncharacterized protein PAC_02550 [Phialocephala subalpina]